MRGIYIYIPINPAFADKSEGYIYIYINIYKYAYLLELFSSFFGPNWGFQTPGPIPNSRGGRGEKTAPIFVKIGARGVHFVTKTVLF